MASLAEIREYNKQVQQYQKKAAELKASIDYKQKELDSLCAEISSMSGQTVTPDNLEEYAAEVERRFEQTLATGKEVLARAKAEEERVKVAAPVTEDAKGGEAETPVESQEAPMQMPNNSPFAGMGFGAFSGFPGINGNYDTTGKVDSL